MTPTWEITSLLKDILAEMKKSNVIQEAELELKKQHFTEWQAVTKGIADTTGDAFYRALSEKLEEHEGGS